MIKMQDGLYLVTQEEYAQLTRKENEMSPFLDKQSGTAMKIEQQRQYEEWQKKIAEAQKGLQERAWNIASGFGQAGVAGLGLGDVPQTQEREVRQATHQLDFALKRLSDAVAELNSRTQDIQRIEPQTTGADSVSERLVPDCAVARVIAQAAIMILDEVEKLEGMERRIQL